MLNLGFQVQDRAKLLKYSRRRKGMTRNPKTVNTEGKGEKTKHPQQPSRIMFDQISGYCDIAKLTHKVT